MAEAWLNHLFGDEFQAESAGVDPAPLNSLAVKAMSDAGMDISSQGTNDVFELYRSGRIFEYVITVCDEISGERCPVFPGVTKTLHWSFPDPASFTGSQREQLQNTRFVRDAIKRKITQWVESLHNENTA